MRPCAASRTDAQCEGGLGPPLDTGYGRYKPGRPSHALHTYWVGNLRLVLDVRVSSGKQHSSLHAKAGLGALLDEPHARCR